jgi:hypothetical protein
VKTNSTAELRLGLKPELPELEPLELDELLELLDELELELLELLELTEPLALSQLDPRPINSPSSTSVDGRHVAESASRLAG